MEKHFHPFHIVNISPWPLLVGFGVLRIIIGIVKLFVSMDLRLVFGSFFLLFFIRMIWWRDIVRERTFQGYHSRVVLKGLIIGILLFILREVFFFLSFFWGFFHSSLSPVVELGSQWPPVGIFPFNPFEVPLLNTVILLSSGIRVTWAHQIILNESWEKVKNSLIITWFLGIYFLFLQGFEYIISPFGIRDSVFGSIFFMATGFHGFHVIIGTFFLFIIWLRVLINQFSKSHHFGFEAAAWYWHFVDVVWLFLFSVVYWWGTCLLSMNTFNFQLKKKIIF